VSSFWFRKGLDFLASDPAHAAALVGRKLLLALSSEEQPLEYNLRLDDNPARVLAPLPFGIALALAALRLGRRRSVVDRRAEVPVLLLLLTQFVLLLAFFVSARYRLPAMPALLAIGGFGVVELWSARRSPWAWTIVALVAVASLAYVPVAQSDLRHHQLAMSWSDRGAALRIAKRLEDSAAAYRRAIDLEPQNPLGHLDLAKTLQASGRTTDAEASVREALRLAPGLAEAWLDLGVMAFRQDRLEEAERAFAEAHRLAPTEPQAANNLLGTRLRLGRRAEAAETYRELTARGVAIDPRLEAWIRDLE
jgi:tetratricopeptide (TPR) repeat protein